VAHARAELLEGVALSVFQEVLPASGARLVFVGDIHGCYAELLELLAEVDLRAGDTVVSVGDIVTKGPAADRCLELWRERGYLAVQGNNELKVLDAARPVLRLFARENREVLRRGDLLRYIASWPLVIDFPAQRVTAVHGGFLPQMQVTRAEVEQHRRVVPKLRWIRRTDGVWRSIPKEKKKKGDVLWAEKWRGNRTVVYGHTPVREPQLDAKAIGLDTGCVYGGALTAAILENGKWRTVSVKARRRYAE
jgi:predicted phosphodiesterase